MKMEQTECSETSAYKIQTPGNYPEENIQHIEHGESLKSRIPSDIFQSHIQLALGVLVPHQQDSNGRNINLTNQNHTREGNSVILVCLLIYVNTPR